MTLRMSGNGERRIWHLVCCFQRQRPGKEDSLASKSTASHSRARKSYRVRDSHMDESCCWADAVNALQA